jgi:hypothetical protein
MATSSSQERLLLMRKALKIYFEFVSETLKQHTLIALLSIAVGFGFLHVPAHGLRIS